MTAGRVLGGEVARRGLLARAPRSRSARGLGLTVLVAVVFLALNQVPIYLKMLGFGVLLPTWWLVWPNRNQATAPLDRWLVKRRWAARARKHWASFVRPDAEGPDQARWVRPVAIGDLTPVDLTGTDYEGLFVLRKANPGKTPDLYLVICATDGLGSGLMSETRYAERTAAFGRMLASAAARNRMVSGFQQLVRVLPHDVAEHLAHIQGQLRPPEVPMRSRVRAGWDALLWSYGEVVAIEEANAEEHRNVLVVEFEVTPGFLRLVGRRGGGNAGVARVVRDELRNLSSTAQAAGFGSLTALGEMRATAVMRAFQNPDYRPDKHGGLSWEADAFRSFHAQPDHLVVDGEWFTRVGCVRAAALEPALLGARWLAPLITDLPEAIVRTVATRIDLVSPQVARAAAVADHTVDRAEARTNLDQGRVDDGTSEVLLSASRRRRDDLKPGSGHAGVRWGLYLTVQARSLNDLQDACMEIENAAHTASASAIDWLEHCQDLAWPAAQPVGAGLGS